MGSAYNSIKVVARFRPQDAAEIKSGGESIVELEGDDTVQVDSRDANASFTFDRVFDIDSRQSNVFDFSIKPTVDDILNGYNGTVFAYGQTGSGKSYTMMGPDIDSPGLKGIIPRIVEQIFASILASPSNIEYTVKVSYMEIYMERIRDLLNRNGFDWSKLMETAQNDNLPVHEEKSRGVYVKGLLEIYVSSILEVYEVMRRGGTARAVAATNMNQESSRSHSIFVINITQKNVESGSAKSGQLFLVDLAGSEKVGKSGASGQTLEEAKKINKSLSALGNVINSLTDGKSSHIPYRDSKLTRILQESLGGNSRTTLIICCSPARFNGSETVSTLRFGTRAKSIKNKAKINAELSPTELKNLLKKAQTQVLTFGQYISLLEGELSAWRSGVSVPADKWVGMGEASQRSLPALRVENQADVQRSANPALEKDEKEEFLRRENELQDLISEKESQIEEHEKALRDVREELSMVKGGYGKAAGESERLAAELDELRMKLEKVSFEGKEAHITMDSLKDANADLSAELDQVKKELMEARLSAAEGGFALEGKEKKKAEKMAQMMAGLNLDEAFVDSEKNVREAIGHLDEAAKGGTLDGSAVKGLRDRLVETQESVRHMEHSLHQRDLSLPAKREAQLEQRLLQVETEYQTLLEGRLDEADVEEIKKRFEEALQGKMQFQAAGAEELKSMLAAKTSDSAELRRTIEQLEQAVQNGSREGGGGNMHQKLAEFDTMKKSLMRDLQNRCERVVELEISLDETREQYNNVLRSNNNKAQQKKMAFLERNLEQLTHVQRQLVDQNSSLKKEVVIAERKLNARNDRIQSLETLLSESQEKLAAANHRFEAQLAAVKERLEAAKGEPSGGQRLTTVSRGLPGSPAGFAFNGSRIAKPLRGGADVQANGSPSRPETPKRAGWFR